MRSGKEVINCCEVPPGEDSPHKPLQPVAPDGLAVKLGLVVHVTALAPEMGL
jgi:hypothetical protein